MSTIQSFCSEDWALDLESPALLAELLPLIPDELAGVDALLAKLLHLNDHALAKVAFEHFPAVTAGQILMATGVAGHRVADAWWQKLKQRPAVMLQSNVLRRGPYEPAFYVQWLNYWAG